MLTLRLEVAPLQNPERYEPLAAAFTRITADTPGPPTRLEQRTHPPLGGETTTFSDPPCLLIKRLPRKTWHPTMRPIQSL